MHISLFIQKVKKTLYQFLTDWKAWWPKFSVKFYVYWLSDLSASTDLQSTVSRLWFVKLYWKYTDSAKSLFWSELRTYRDKFLFLQNQNIGIFRKLCILEKEKYVIRSLILIIHDWKTFKTLSWASTDSFKILS